MQSVKYFAVIATLLVSGELAFAAPTTDLPILPQVAEKAASSKPMPEKIPPHGDVNPVVSTAESVPAQAEKPVQMTIQEQLEQLVEDDYAFQSAKRKLENEVALEKMRSEIRKLRGEDKKAPASPAAPVRKAEPETNAKLSVPVATALPHVVLESVIGGRARVAIVNHSGDQLRYAAPGEMFSMDGLQYILKKDKEAGLKVEEVVP